MIDVLPPDHLVAVHAGGRTESDDINRKSVCLACSFRKKPNGAICIYRWSYDNVVIGLGRTADDGRRP